MNKNERLSLGASEAEVLTYIASHPGVTVGQVAQYFASAKGWVRTTLQTTMDRLLAKGLLRRQSGEGIARYESTMSSQNIREGLVSTFVEGTLGGSLSPFVAYLSGGANITEQDHAELKRLVEELDRRRGK